MDQYIRRVSEITFIVYGNNTKNGKPRVIQGSKHDNHNILSLAMPDGDGNENFSNKYIL